MVYTCATCYRQYKTKNGYEKHSFICKSQHSNNTTTMDDFKELPTQAFMMKMIMEMSAKITSLEAKLFTVLTEQNKINETHTAYTKKETLSILNRQEKEDIEEVEETECKNYKEWITELQIKTTDVNIILNKKMLRGLVTIIKTLLRQQESPIKKIGQQYYYYDDNEWHEFTERGLLDFISSIRNLLLKKFNDIYCKKFPLDSENSSIFSSMNASERMQYLEQVKIMTNRDVSSEQILSLIIK